MGDFKYVVRNLEINNRAEFQRFCLVFSAVISGYLVLFIVQFNPYFRLLAPISIAGYVTKMADTC